jgi:hypothetical protein
MNFAMMPDTRERLIAGVAAQRPGLRKSQVMGVRRLPAANEAGPHGNRSHVTAGPEFDAVLDPLVRYKVWGVEVILPRDSDQCPQ